VNEPTPNLILRQVPEAVRSQAAALGFADGECLFAARSDLTLDARPHDVWLLVGRRRIVAIEADAAPGEGITGPFDLKDIEKVRAFQAVGSAFIQFQVKGLYVDVVRYSNAFRELFSRVRTQIENLLAGEPVELDALLQPSDMICETCGLPLPGRGTPCPRCTARRGIFLRAAALMKPYRHYILLLMGMMMLGMGVRLIPPQLQRFLVDRVLSTGENVHLLPWILLGFLVAGAAHATLNVFIGRTSSFVGTRITRELRERLQEKFLSLGVDYYDRNSVGQLMSRVLYDVDFFHGFVVQVAQGFLLNCLLVIGIGAVLFAMNWRLAFLVLLPIPLVVVGTLFFYRTIYPRYYRLSDSRAKMARLLTGLLSGIRLVKSFGQESKERERFTKSAEYMQEARRAVEMSVSSFNPVMAFLFNLGGLLVWYAGGKMVLNTPMTLGTLLAFATYLSMFYQPITAMTVFGNWMTGFISAAQRVFDVLDAVPSLRPPAKPVPLPRIRGAVEFRNVTFGYDPYSPVLKNVSLKIEPGQFVGIVGKSGSGKTTLVSLLCRFYDPQRGRVLIDGVDIREIAPDDLYRQVSLVLQESFLFRASIAENIAYGVPDADPGAIIQAAKAANAHDFIAQRPSAYDTPLGERGAGLSGGERQRVSIARALLRDPRILILDEATSSVDTESEQAIQKSLEIFGRGRTTIVIAHRLSTLKYADRIFVIDDGQLVEEGSHEELLALEGIYYRLVKIQTELTRLELETHA